MPDDFHSTAIVLETFSDNCLEDLRAVIKPVRDH